MQEALNGDQVQGLEFLNSYISTMLTPNPGDVVITGTPGGMGHTREPHDI